MRAGEQTSRHLLLAVITTVFSGMLGLTTVVMAWELWMVPLMAAGCFSVWLLHIAKIGSGVFYENLCAGFVLLEFRSLYHVPESDHHVFFIWHLNPTCRFAWYWRFNTDIRRR